MKPDSITNSYWDHEIPDFEYFDHPNISASDIIKALKGAAEFFYSSSNSDLLSSSPARDFGSSFHEMVLLDRPSPMRKHTKAALEHLEKMRQRVLQVFPCLKTGHPDHSSIQTEVAGFTVAGENDKYPLKFKADILIPHKKILVDLKTTADATPENFKWSAKKYNYHIQAAHYLDCANRIDGQGSYETFLFVAVEKTYPYKIFVHECSPKILAEGLAIRDEMLEKVLIWKNNQSSLLDKILEDQEKIYILDW